MQTSIFTEAIPLSLYIHLPWCVKKCPYCDFNSHAFDPTNIPEREYVDALLTDLEHDLPLVWGRTVSSIFIGGGTPSLFSAEAIDRLLAGVRARLPLLGDIEVTLEANPGTVEQARFTEFRDVGINRLSLGIQSFHSPSLVKLGRIHDGRQSHHAVEIAQTAGFDNLNLDLMFGLPGQSLEGSRTDLQTAIQYSPSHISFYQLTLEPNTLFHHNPPELPGDDELWRMQDAGAASLEKADYGQYEVSAFAKAGHECRHNQNYWEFGDYLGIGAGAHGKYTDMAEQKVVRLTKQRHPDSYLSPNIGQVSSSRNLSSEELVFEFMLNALRLTNGFSNNLFQQRTGLSWAEVEGEISMLIDEGLINKIDDHLSPTVLGRKFLNELTERFLPDATD